MIIKNIDNLTEKFDFTIIGSGPASLSLALKLEKKGFKVIIFEAGDLSPTEENQKMYEGSNVGDKYFDLDVTRLRCFGGSSQHWAGWCRTLDDYDFDEWPIKKKDLDTYLTEACNILEINNLFIKKKIDNNIDQINFNFSPPVRFNEKYLNQIKKSKKIYLILNTPLLKIIGDDEGEAKSIEVNNLSVNKDFKVNKIILACGGIENSRILLWSKLKSNNNFLKNINPGHYWMEHPHYDVANFVGDTSKLKKHFDTSISKDNHFFISLNNKFNKESGIRNNALRFQYQASYNFTDQMMYDLYCSGPKFANKIINLFKKDFACFYVLKMVWEQVPNLDSKITLSNTEKDYFNIPTVELNWKKKSEDLITPFKVLKKLGNFFIEKDIGRIGIYDFVKGEKKEFPNNDDGGGHHHMGGTRIGNGFNKYDVVDENLKVFNTKNLYVAGSSIFRTGGHANPTLTIVQLSLRLADHLSKI